MVKKTVKNIFYFFLIPFLFYLILVILSQKKWACVGLGGCEYSIYILSSSYIDKLWKGFIQIKNFRNFFVWLPAFFFQLSPFETGEKPLFVMGLGYFSFICRIFFKNIPFPLDTLFNMLIMLISGYLIFMIFHNLKEPLFGVLASSLFFLNIGLNLYSMKGYHTTFGIFMFLLLVYFYNKWQHLSAKRAFILGLFLSWLFFSSHHVILLCISSFIFIVFQMYRQRKDGGLYAKNINFFILGILSLFIYFSLRDFIFSLGFLDRYRLPELSLYLQQNYDRNTPLVFQSIFRRVEKAIEAKPPWLDITYLYYYLKDMEGALFLPFLLLAIAAPFLFKTISLNYFRNVISENEIEYRKKKLFIFLLFNILIFLLMMVSIPLTYIARAYLPVTILMIICAVLGLSMMYKRISVMRPLMVCFLFIIILIQVFHYQGITSGLCRDDHLADTNVAVAEIRMDTKIMTLQEIIDYLFNLYHLQNVKKVYFKPFIFNLTGYPYPNYSIYQFFINLIEKGLAPKKIKCTNSQVKLEFYIDENAYYQLARKRWTDGLHKPSLNIKIANIFDPYSYYVFELKDTLFYIDKYQNSFYPLENKEGRFLAPNDENSFN